MTALSSTEFLIQFRTGPMPRPALVPGYLRRDFDPARLGAWLVALVAALMTVEWCGEQARGAFDSAVFVAVMGVICGCVAWMQVRQLAYKFY